MEQSSSPAVEFRAVSRHFGSGDAVVRAVDEVTFSIRDGEFFTMLGPSGSGKTTCLRLVAGFEQPSAGSIALHGRDVTRLPPYERDVNTVFQDYALFPHMSVADNIGYGLMVKRVPAAERGSRVDQMLDMMQLVGLGRRRPSQLSGGQRQRVALARALINRPRVLLLDEPLGALDLKLRQQMQFELKAIQQRVGITFIFVTHDQEEAMAMSDRIAIFSRGKVVQVGAPRELYEDPQTEFVASFLGVTNFIRGDAALALAGEAASYSIRPEHCRLVSVGDPADGEVRASGTVTSATFLGMYSRYAVALDAGGEIILFSQNGSRSQTVFEPGERAVVGWPREGMKRVGS